MYKLILLSSNAEMITPVPLTSLHLLNKGVVFNHIYIYLMFALRIHPSLNRKVYSKVSSLIFPFDITYFA